MKFPRKTYTLENGCITCAKMLPRGKREIEPRVFQDGKWEHFFEGGRWRASRLSYHLNTAPIPRQPPNTKEGFVLHTCDNEWCINPEHLYLGTIKQNTRDKFDRHPNIRTILSEGGKRAWENRSDEVKAKTLANLWGQVGKPSYVRTEVHRQRAAETRRANWDKMTPEQRAEMSRRISEGRKRK